MTRVMGFLPANVQLSWPFRSGWNVKTEYKSPASSAIAGDDL